MNKDPILAVKTLPVGGGYRVQRTMKVEGGLHYIRDNSAPYFALTATIHRKGFPNQCESGGCCHELILKHFPKFADLAALHLSDINGEPMHAVANGWYHLAGALPNTGERYHAGNSGRHFPITPPDAKPWQTTEYRKPTQNECLQLFADYWRISLEEATRIKLCVEHAGALKDLGEPANAIMADEAAKLRPTWKRQAEECIAKHNLRVYGDAWNAA